MRGAWPKVPQLGMRIRRGRSWRRLSSRPGRGRAAACVQHVDGAAERSPARMERGDDAARLSLACARKGQRVPAYSRPPARSEVHCAQPERVAARNKRRGVCHALWNELSTALGATTCQYGAAILRSHTCTEPVRARPPHFARLIGALHSMDSVDGPWVSKRAARLSR
jgi:hypothetical protein